ncbi:KPN_02809 family neutral zinc metallopeptidase [Microbacterium sp. A93]|uniref:KPN_02809 family neutral zinc metallopeptidase n=1 Tax=Microbacterium sp. A93 TaxID=3450716 RepID=UPI003F433085
MSFNDDVQLDPSRVRDSRGRGGRGGGRGGRGGKIAIGGGAGGILVLLIVLFAPGLAQDLGLTGAEDGGAGGYQGEPAGPAAIERCLTGEDADARVDCRILATVESADAFWDPFLAEYDVQWREPGMELFSGNVETGCGAASSEVGPFYCPADEYAYFDTDFFGLLESEFGSSGGPLAQEYVVAHEYGHHIQNIVGYLQYSQSGGTGPESGAVRVELQADCYAGLWAGHAARIEDPESGVPFLEPVTESDLADALSAAGAVGDDRIQQKTAGRVMPEAFTHGTSEQRMAWFMAGYEAQDLNQCNTLDHPDLDQPTA